ncbi:MAG TPA: shikimate dehydrogenase [Bacteroidales bacterium]|nr:shikimate dehydrogenase [Bacteroidales bacterium]
MPGKWILLFLFTYDLRLPTHDLRLISPPMRTFGLIGYPLSHSFSKGYFSDKFLKEKLDDCSYNNYPIEDIGLLHQVLAGNPSLQGLNVTIPYKEKVIPFLDDISAEAKEIGAVNTIRIAHRNNKLHLKGFNTDVYGFMESLRPLLQQHHQRALVLGTGGASKAVHFALRKLGISATSVSRNKSENNLVYDDLSEDVFCEHKLIVNTTPLGTYPNVEGCPPLPYQYLTPEHLLYDLVYNPPVTAFLDHGLQHGCTVKNGLEMLHLQAEKAWQIWNAHE